MEFVTKTGIFHWPLPREQASVGAGGGPHCPGWGALHTQESVPPDLVGLTPGVGGDGASF